MAYPNQETEVKVSSQGADSFVSWYYQDLNDHRSLASYYVNSSSKYANAGVTADVTINGAHLANPTEYEALLDAQRGVNKTNGDHNTRSGTTKVRYEVASHDTQVLNNDYGLGCPEGILSKGPDKSGGRISMLVTVMGVVHLGSGADTQHKRFHEVFVLVPNWDVRGRNAPRNGKRFLISSQNYRTL
ncbi:nuclear transport factor 2 domain-containing protein [Diaporthe amygdali]|uniref:nuclear transport factor 2 domain-containing protein n=1 Tax=Phomopsis amygdali TaxID=1214568 RepID=UPI0022FE0DE0|nr:nuclear transport factor 2 domain-containing protein [Diaporthe amygdali]KAJ0117181.1 nuclear transport factor 2 domain-containing protein [Diaporthe amygdali]